MASVAWQRGEGTKWRRLPGNGGKRGGNGGGGYLATGGGAKGKAPSLYREWAQVVPGWGWGAQFELGWAQFILGKG